MKLALDWDDEQVRMVAADCSARGIRIRAAAVVPIGEDGLQGTLTELTRKYSLEKSDVLVAIGRDRAELRQMQFPPVPLEELPIMVRFQAIRQFASAGDSAEIDFITTHVDEKGIHAIVAATGPAQLTPIRKAVEKAGWNLQRVGLRPIAAAALYRLKASEVLRDTSKAGDESEPVVALIDVVANEAEIVLLRNGEITFVRSVRLPDGDAATTKSRATSLAGEIRRSLIACGAGGANCNVVMWGSVERHGEELKLLAERLSGQQDIPCETRLLDPLELVGTDAKVREATGEMVGRLAPLVGLLVADASNEEELIDFLNPRKTIEATTDKRKLALMIGVPVVIVLALGWLLWSNISRLNTQIERQTAANKTLREKTKAADEMITRTEQIDQFLDSDVNWLDEFEQLAASMPPSDELIVKEVLAASNPRGGGGRIVVTGLVTSPDVIKQFENVMRDESHQVIGDKVTQLASDDAYRWKMSETIRLAPEAVRTKRYERMLAFTMASDAPEPNVDRAPLSAAQPVTNIQPVPIGKPGTSSEPQPVTEPQPSVAPQPSPAPQLGTEPKVSPAPQLNSDSQPVTEPQPAPQATDVVPADTKTTPTTAEAPMTEATPTAEVPPTTDASPTMETPNSETPPTTPSESEAI